MDRLFRLRSILAGVLFVLALLLCLRSWLDVRFANRVAPNLPTTATKRRPLTDRVVLFLFDDTGYSAAERNLKGILGKAKEQGWIGRVTLDRYTFTIAAVYTLGTGDQPSLLQIKDEFAAQPVAVDSIFAAIRRGGGRSAVFGEVLWEDLFRNHLDAAFTRRDLGPFIEYGSDQMLSKLSESLKKNEERLTVVHLGETGHVNHRVGVNGVEIARLLGELDRRVLELSQRDAARTTWLIGGDHGTTPEGQHGGETSAERTTFLAAFGPGIRKLGSVALSQVDIPNIVALLTGAPLPTQGCGLIPQVFTEESRGTVDQARAELLVQKQALYHGLVAEYGTDETVDETDSIALKRAIDHTKLNAGNAREVLGSLFVFLSIIGLYFLYGNTKYRLTAATTAFVLAVTSTLLPFRYALFAGLPLAVAVAFLGTQRLRKRTLPEFPLLPIVIAFLIPGVFFFLYPSLVYLRQTQTVRYLWLSALLVPIGLCLLLWPFFAPKLRESTRRWGSGFLWGLGVALVVATEMRYYQTIIPVGLLLLLGVAWLPETPSPIRTIVSYLKSLGFGLLLLLLAYAYLGWGDLSFLKTLKQAFHQTTWTTEVILVLAVAVTAPFTSRFYRGDFGLWSRMLPWTGVVLAHLAFHMKLAPTNGTLLCVVMLALSLPLLGLLRDRHEARPYWLFMLVLVLATQQQAALHLVLCLIGAAVIRGFLARNPYPTNDWRNPAFLALLLLCYWVTFLSTKGHLIRPAHFETLRGFVGYGMPLYFPLSISLVCFYYLQPVLIAWTFSAATLPEAPAFAPTGRVLTLLTLGQVLFTVLLLSFSTVPGDTYQKSLAGAMLSLVLAIGSILAESLGQRGGITGNGGLLPRCMPPEPRGKNEECGDKRR